MTVMEVPIDAINRLTYRPEVRFMVEDDPEGLILYVISDVEDSRNPGDVVTIYHPTRVPLPLSTLGGTDDEWVAFARQCLITFAIHEVDEWLRLDGELVNDPHRMDAFISTVEA